MPSRNMSRIIIFMNDRIRARTIDYCFRNTLPIRCRATGQFVAKNASADC
jgi:hypothetical protein